MSRVCSSRLNMCDITTIISVWVETSQEMLKTMAMCLLSGAAAITARRMLLTLPPPPVYTGYPPQPRLHCARLPHFLQLGGRGRAAVVRWGQQDTHTYIRHYLIYYPGHIFKEKSWYNSCVTSSHATTLPHPNQTFQWFVE